MKKIILFCAVLFLVSCTKDWECCVETTTSGLTGVQESANGTMTNCIDFRGTNEEKNEFEENGTSTVSYSTPWEYTIEQSTDCTLD